MKIVDKMRKSMEEGTNFYSFEFFPPRTDEVSTRPLTFEMKSYS